MSWHDISKWQLYPALGTRLGNALQKFVKTDITPARA